MGEMIYGVDSDGEITPIIVRDAIVRCFKDAHKEILNEKNKHHEYESESEQETLEHMQIELIIMSAFDDAQEDFENPTKEGIKKVLNLLAEFASKYRKPEIIKKHYNEIMKLVKKLE